MNGTKIQVIDDTYKYVTEPAYSDDSWSRDSTNTTHNIRGIKVADENSYYDFQCGIQNIIPGKDYYLVYVNYDTGDSFGRDGGRIDFIDLFEKRELAIKLAEAIRTDNAKGFGFEKHDNEVNYEIDNGEMRECYTGGWKGYFEYLNEIVVELVRFTDRRVF